MPMYDFACTSESCGAEFEDITPMGAEPPPCPECGGAAERRMSAPFVGQGKIVHMSPKARKYLSPEHQAKLKSNAASRGKQVGRPKK
jgi:putative FmdB family regulatory protein